MTTTSRGIDSALPDDPKTLSAKEWRERLTPEQFRVCREKGTEAPHLNKYAYHKDDGVYHCVCCDNPLFRSSEKYDSGSGWPSYYAPVAIDAVEYHEDSSLGMIRTEVTCGKCGAHLGHVFDDGPEPTGKRYCINSVCLAFVPQEDAE